MKLSDFRYHLPPELIAYHPSKNREECRLMVLNKKTQTIEHKLFKDVLSYFGNGDVMIINNTRVFPARLFGTKEKTGAKIEVFLFLRIANIVYQRCEVQYFHKYFINEIFNPSQKVSHLST